MTAFIHVAFEGIDGSGKGLQIRYLAEELNRRGTYNIVTAEPSVRTELGRVIREQFYEHTLSDSEMNVLFAAERIVHRRLWMPSMVDALANPLAETAYVLSDRSVLSAYAYHGLDCEWHKWLSPESTWPDHAIILDVNPVNALERVNAAHGRRGHDRWENIERLQRAQENYHKLAERENVHLIDGEGSVFEVAARVLKEFDSWKT